MSAELAGRLIITWPKANDYVAGYGIALTDAETGKQITTAMNGEMTIRMDATELVTVELTMLTNAGGKPLQSGEPVVTDETGENFRTGRFHWAVAEMRVADE